MRSIVAIVVVIISAVAAGPARAQDVRELLGSWIIDGYKFEPGDRSPRGTIAYDPEANVFRGTYVGLKLPAERPDLHVWLYNTQSKKSQRIGKVAYRTATVGKTKGEFSLPLPAQFKGGKFDGYELVAFSAEARGATPKEPSGSAIQIGQKPAFYLYAALPGASVPGIYCGHGLDFSFTSNQDHTCFD
jgi:hypothetical protein